jgi:Fe-S cluster assembly protein SufD
MAQVSLLRTEAEQRIAAEWASAKARLPGPAGLREAAFRRFEANGLPHRRIEEWKYTDLRTLMREAKPLAQSPDRAARERARNAGGLLADIEARRLVFVNGAFAPDLSDLAAIEPGLKISSLGDALSRGDADVSVRLGAASAADNDVGYALNTAFMADGAVIDVAPGATIARPIHLVFAFVGEPAAVFVRSLVTVGAGATLTLIESHEGPDNADYQVNTAIDLIVGDAAKVERVMVGTQGRSALHVATLTAALGRAVDFRDFAFTTGGAVVRNQLFVRCNGADTALGLSGATLLAARQHADTTMVVDHAVGGCRSREVIKSVLDGQSRSVFQGKIIVRPDAQKTDARMLSNALMLSPDAEADNKPELEIFADDVQCGHGATAGSIDEDLKFYLMARGIPAAQAEALLIQSFVGEAIDLVTHEGVREALSAAVLRWLQARGV